jgi:succinate dehydrogenase / fumarate reductase cytochrome b subunit
MPRLVRLKILSSLSGLFLGLFLVAHMMGNLKYFGGAEALDSYAIFLREVGKEFLGEGVALWIFRLLLLTALLVHLYSTVLLYKLSAKSRGHYVMIYRSCSSLASRNMLVLGVLVLTFVVFHISHLTLGLVHPEGFRHLAVHNNVTISFSKLSYLIAYLIGVGAVALHFSVGARSLVQSLGWTEVSKRSTRIISQAVALVLFLGFMSVPFFVYIKSLYAR